MFNFGFNMFPENRRSFNTYYKCFSVSMLPGNEREDVECGGKIIMPPSGLEQLTQLNVNYPMLFKITNPKMSRITHCGVLEFVADEGVIYVPLWMMHNLLLEEGDTIQIESVSLPVATFSRFQPQSTDFLDITNPKAVLENALRNFACLTKGDMIAIKYNKKIYELSVLETKPETAVSIIECDMNVEFAPSIDYEKPEKHKGEENLPEVPHEYLSESTGFVPFSGTGHRLDGKQKKSSNKSDSPTQKSYIRGIPDYEFEIGSITFLRNSKPKEETRSTDEFKPFSGLPHTLRK